MLRRWFDPARRLQAADGQVLLLFAAGLVAFCGLVGMSVDVGHVVYTHTDLQKAADGAALAGAQDLNGTSASVATAEATADKYLVDNGYASASCRPNCASVDGTYTKITVSVAHTVDFYFLRAVGLSGSTPSATAVSQMYSKTVTGYDWNSVAPFTIWGGSRSNEVHAGDANCVLHTCVGKSYTFLDTGWMTANGSPTDPDWTANGSNNFKGDINHGAGSPIIQVGDSFQSSSNGGLGSVTAPDVGTTIVIPVMSKASGNSNNRTFTIGEWVLVTAANSTVAAPCSAKPRRPPALSRPAPYSRHPQPCRSF